MGAVIDQKAFDGSAATSTGARVGHDRRRRQGRRVDGLLRVADAGRDEGPEPPLLCEEIFGPVVTVHVYHDGQWSDMLSLVDRTSPYALTGAVFARDRAAVREAMTTLRQAAGNFYINDKPTGAVVGQQPFGGARPSGTNDKAGSKLNLLRWTSARTIKETFVPPTDYRYPFMGPA